MHVYSAQILLYMNYGCTDVCHFMVDNYKRDFPLKSRCQGHRTCASLKKKIKFQSKYILCNIICVMQILLVITLSSF